MGFPFVHFSDSLLAGGEGWANLIQWVFANGYVVTLLPGIHDGQRCRVFVVSASTAARLAAKYHDRGAVAPKRQGRAPGTAGKLRPHIASLVEIVRAEPHITLKELAGALKETHGVSVQLSSIHRALVRSGLSSEKRPDRAGACAGCYQAGAF